MSFYCKHGDKAVPLVPLGMQVIKGDDPVAVKTYKCPVCKREILYIVSKSKLKEMAVDHLQQAKKIANDSGSKLRKNG